MKETAERWAKTLCPLGHRVDVCQQTTGRYDLLLALQAFESFPRSRASGIDTPSPPAPRPSPD